MSMDENISKLKELKDLIKARDSELQRAAKYGKQLLTEKQKLQDEVNELKQGKHSLQLNLESKISIADNLTVEIELQRTSYDKLKLSCDELKKENSNLKQKLRVEQSKNEDLKLDENESLEKETAFKRKISLLEQEIEKQNIQLQVSLNETNSEEHHKVMTELKLCLEEKKVMFNHMTHLQLELDEKKSEVEKLINLFEQMQMEIKDKDEELRSYSVIVQKSKEEVTELMGEIEILKFHQTDVNQRGNSIFSEVEDRRKLVEKEYVMLKRKYRDLEEQSQLHHKEQSKLKKQLSIALSMFSQRVEQQYVEELHSSLNGAKKEIEYLTECLNEYIKAQKDSLDSGSLDMQSTTEKYDYLRTLYSNSQKKVDDLQRDLQHQRMIKIAESEKLLSTQKKLYTTEQQLCAHKGEILKLKLKMEDMDKFTAEEVIKPKVERIPAFTNKENALPTLNLGTSTLQDKLRTNKAGVCQENRENLQETRNVILSEKVVQPQRISTPDDVTRNIKTSSVPTINMAANQQNCTQQ